MYCRYGYRSNRHVDIILLIFLLNIIQCHNMRSVSSSNILIVLQDKMRSGIIITKAC